MLQMDSHSLAFEFAPVLLWQRGKCKSQSGKSRPLAAGSFRLSKLTPVIERPREEAAALSEHNSSNGSREGSAFLSERQPSNVSVTVNVEDAGSERPQVQGTDPSDDYFLVLEKASWSSSAGLTLSGTRKLLIMCFFYRR
jgi:hypothetical protein